MRRLREFVDRFGGLFNKQRKDRELDEEIESHLRHATKVHSLVGPEIRVSRGGKRTL